MIISKTRIINTNFLDNCDIDKIKIGIHVTNEEYKKLNLNSFEEGMTVQPSPSLGLNCKKNAFGYSYPDKSKSKENRYIQTIEWTWQQWAPGGGTEECSKLVDIYRDAYPRIYVPAANVELTLTLNDKGEHFIIADLNSISKGAYIKQTINMLLEIFGFCEIFAEDLNLISNKNKIKRCNWELLPPGIKAKVEERNKQTKQNNKRKGFDQLRLDTLDSYNPLEIFVGTGGFTGYYAYIFEKTCYLENAVYGNATYVVPKDNWKDLSQLSKNQLLATRKVIDKITHNSEWLNKLKILMKKTEGK
jgi:hypothetical protein